MRRYEGVFNIFPVVHVVVNRQKLNPLKLVKLELKLFFGCSAHRLERDTGFTGNFSHRHCLISLDAFFDELAVPSGVDGALSAASRTVTCVAELLEPIDGQR